MNLSTEGGILPFNQFTAVQRPRVEFSFTGLILYSKVILVGLEGKFWAMAAACNKNLRGFWIDNLGGVVTPLEPPTRSNEVMVPLSSRFSFLIVYNRLISRNSILGYRSRNIRTTCGKKHFLAI